MQLRPLEQRLRGPQQRLRLRRRRNRGRIVGKGAGLQLADPVPGRGVHQLRIGFQTALELLLVEVGIIEAAERRRQAAQRANQLELPNDPVDPRGRTRARRAKPMPASASRCTSASGSPQARRWVRK